MKIKDAALAMALSGVFVLAIDWVERDWLWLVWLIVTYTCWELILKAEQFFRWAKRRLLKMKSARGAATPGRAHRN